MSSDGEEEPVAGAAGEDAPAGGAVDGARGGARGSVLSAKKLAAQQARYDKRGVVYLSRLPPFMKPVKLRHLLAQHGEVLRIYLAAEDSAARAKRKKAGGNSGKKFTEGWVEFADKRVAKRVAAMLNGQQIGGPRRSAFYYDLWTIKYLSKFKWDQLTEELAYQKAVKEQKMALELAAATRERDFYLRQVDAGKALDAMQAKQQKRAAAAAAAGEGGEGGEAQAPPPAASGAKAGAPQGKTRSIRRFTQRPVRAAPGSSRLSQSVLASVFGTPMVETGGGDNVEQELPRKKHRNAAQE